MIVIEGLLSLTRTWHSDQEKAAPQQVEDRLCQGWLDALLRSSRALFRDTLTEQIRKDLAIAEASLIMIDCDVYSASKDALTFYEPHIRKHAIILLNGWGGARTEARSDKRRPSKSSCLNIQISQQSLCPRIYVRHGSSS
jgi:hypothetical protein